MNNALKAFCAENKLEHPATVVKKALEMYGEDVAISFSGAEDVLLVEYAK